jgi:hypothetical protein
MSAQISPQTQDFNKTRAAFMQRASAPHVPPIAFKLAYLIAFKYLNRKTGTTFVAQDTLARDLKLSDRHVRRLLDILRPLGLGIAPGDGRGKASTYWLDPVTATGAERRTPMSTFTDQKVDKKGGHLASKKVDSHVRPTLLKRTKKNPSGKCYAFPQKDGERSRVRAKENPLGGDPAADAAPRQQGSKQGQQGSKQARTGCVKRDTRARPQQQRPQPGASRKASKRLWAIARYANYARMGMATHSARCGRYGSAGMPATTARRR